MTLKVPYSAVAIACSAGGPQALKTLLSSLSSDFPIPIFIVQHLSDGYTEDFAQWLGKQTELKVKVATDNYLAKSGEVILAPDRFHLEVTGANLCILNDDPPVKELKPAASKLFASMAIVHGNRGIGIILSGMGRDGVEELLMMKQRGALTLAQSEEGCTIFGMPQEAIKIGAVRDVVPIQDLGPLLTSTLTI